MIETVNLKVDGMSCANCALTIGNYLKKAGLENVKVSLIGGDVSFKATDKKLSSDIIKGIESLGYRIRATDSHSKRPRRFLTGHLSKFIFCVVFTIPLSLHMVERWIHVHWLMNPWVQLLLCLPVYIVGMDFFGKSALKSIRNGIPNMNVLVALGATAAFVYSLAGTIGGYGDSYIYYETAAAIITFIFFGNYMEEITVRSTQRVIEKLTRSQQVMANMIAFDDQHQEQIFPVDSSQLRNGDLILIRAGEQVPADCKILWGDAAADERIVTGESLPVEKGTKDKLIGGSVLVTGAVRAQVIAGRDESVLANIVRMVKQAQGEKPPVQQFADKISAIFVPVVLGVALVTLAANWIYLGEFATSLARSIAVLVIACPCAMGLATPAAIAVGLGRAARNGVLFRHAKGLELFQNVRQVVFDKTGTLTTGEFAIADVSLAGDDSLVTLDQLKQIASSLEKFSNHPIARSIATAWRTKDEIRWKKIEEIKGFGMKGEDRDGNIFLAGSRALAADLHLPVDAGHSVLIVRNGVLLGWIDVEDQLRPEARAVVDYFSNKNIKTILLSGDTEQNCAAVAKHLSIDKVFAGKTPAEKLELISEMAVEFPTAMIGDGVNDAPALAKATIGVSMSDASQVAVQTADIVLMDNGIRRFPFAL